MADRTRDYPGRDVVDLGSDILRIDLRRAIVAGAFAAVFIFLSTWGMGRIGDAEAIALLEAILPTTRFLASSALGASATILALMLTVLSLSQTLDQGFERAQFQRISQIALLCTILLSASTLLLLFLNVPLKESEQLNAWYAFVYYFTVSYSSLIGGLLITTIVMLYAAVRSIIRLLEPDAESE